MSASRANNAALNAALNADPFTKRKAEPWFLKPAAKKLSPGNQARKNAKNALTKRVLRKWKKVLNKPNVAERVKAKRNEKARREANARAAEAAKFKATAERAAARKAELNKARRETVILGEGSVGPRGKLTKTAKAVSSSNKPAPPPVSRAQAPSFNMPRTTGLSANAVARMSAVVAREVKKPNASRQRLEKKMKSMKR